MKSRIFYAQIDDGKIKLDNPHDWGALYKEFAGQSIEISVTPLGTKRNDKQNRFYWKVIVGELSKEFGYTKEEMHKALKLKFDIQSTKHLSIKDFSIYINEIIDWAILEHNCTISTKLHESS